MKTYLECLPCLGKNAVDVAKRSTEDETTRQSIVAESFCTLASTDMKMPPPYFARKIMDIGVRQTGVSALYKGEKEKSNRMARQLLEEIQTMPEFRLDEFESRMRLAVAGNILDFGIYAELDMACALEGVKSAFSKPLDTAAAALLQAKMEQARRILYVLDNCGEAVFDRFFLAPYREKVTLCVRGQEAFNDVTEADLDGCGFNGWKYVKNGDWGIPGVVLSEAGEEFKRAFSEADLIVAKGQGNFETMNECTRPIAFLFLAKCPVVVRLIGAEVNSIQVRLINIKE